MGLRYATVVLGAVILASATALSSTVVEPQRAGAATTTVETCGGGSITLKAREKRILVLHNRTRANHSLKPLCVNPRLTRAARSHSREMIKKDYFSHDSYDGEGTGARLRRFGYDWSVYGENIAGGSGTSGEPHPIFELWMNDAAHKANILDGRFRQVGVGAYTGNYKGTGGCTMYTVDFGSRR
ncbi:MAG: CAP domain-containing protein [Actinomycetota bacterium]|nr:CAP domain-containing protein [Actinomycetota bacterium]